MEVKKHRKTYTKVEKLSLVQEYLLNVDSRSHFEKSHGLSRSSISRWLEIYEIEKEQEKKQSPHNPMTAEEKNKQLEAELKKLKLDLKKTQAELEFEQIKSQAWERMVDLAEETFHIKIKKNSGAK